VTLCRSKTKDDFEENSSLSNKDCIKRQGMLFLYASHFLVFSIVGGNTIKQVETQQCLLALLSYKVESCVLIRLPNISMI